MHTPVDHEALLREEKYIIYNAEDKNNDTKSIRNMKVFEKPVAKQIQQPQGFEQHYVDVIGAYRYESKDDNLNKMKDQFI